MPKQWRIINRENSGDYTCMPAANPNREKSRVVIIGAGFAGITAARRLGKLPVDVTIIDRKNHHTFQPLLYQVALAVLSPGDIAQPIRSILHKYRNTEVVMDEVVGIDTHGAAGVAGEWHDDGV